MSDLEAYLMQKSKKKSLEVDAPLTSLEMKASLTTPTKLSYASEDYSPGSEYWSKAMTSHSIIANNVDVVKSTSQRKEKFVEFKPLKASGGSSSVANLLKRMKVNEVPRIDENAAENTIMSMEEKLSEVSKTVEDPNSTRIIEAIKALAQKLETEKKEILNLLQSGIRSNENVLKFDQLDDVLEKKIGRLESHWSKQCNQLGSIAPSETDSKTLQREILQQLTVIQTEILGSKNPIDRPTKAIISSMNDKLIHMAKMQEHEFANQLQKLSLIDRKIARPHASIVDQAEVFQDIRKMVIAIDSHIGRVERQQLADNNRIEKLLKLGFGDKTRQFNGESSEEDSTEKDQMIQCQLADLKKTIIKDQKLTEERMSQFMNMFTILQTAHLELLERLEKLDNTSAKVDALGLKLEKMSAAYLPQSLTSKLVSIERELRNLKK